MRIFTPGRFVGEWWSRDIGLAAAFHRPTLGRFRYELFLLLFRTSLTIGFRHRRRWT